MLKRSHYTALAAVALLLIVIWSLPDRTTARLKLGLGSLFLPLFGLAGSSRELAARSADMLVPRRELLRQNEILVRENQELLLKLARQEALESENTRLRALVGWKQQQRWNLKLARVIAREPSNWWRMVHIDLGSRDGIRQNMPVLTVTGLAGRVSEVSATHSQVVLLGDSSCKVAARIENASRDTGIIGPGGPLDHDLVELSYLSRSAAPEPGQIVKTSGEGSVFPRDIMIGTVVDSHSVEFGLYTVARVKLAANLGALEEVWVLFSAADRANTTTSK